MHVVSRFSRAAFVPTGWLAGVVVAIPPNDETGAYEFLNGLDNGGGDDFATKSAETCLWALNAGEIGEFTPEPHMFPPLVYGGTAFVVSGEAWRRLRAERF